MGCHWLEGDAMPLWSAIVAGDHQFTATYNGKQNFVTSLSNTVAYTINACNTTTELTVDVNPQVFGQAVTFTGDACRCALP